MKDKDPGNGRVRLYYFDYLRVVAAFTVVLAHVNTQKMGLISVTDGGWIAMNFYEAIARWSVIAFVMMSGALFLKKDMSLRAIFSKYISKLCIAYVLWAVFYGVYTPVLCRLLHKPYEVIIPDIIMDIINGNYHMWFVPMIAGLYALQPLLRPIAASEEKRRYFLLLFFIFASLIPTFVTLCNDFAPEGFVDRLNIVYDVFMANSCMRLVMGYTGYFMWGYHLAVTDIPTRMRKAIYVLGVLGFAMTILLNQYVALRDMANISTYYGSFNLNVLLEAMGVFVWFKYNMNSEGRFFKLISIISDASFGIYLMHPFIIRCLEVAGIHALFMDPIVAVPLTAVIVFMISLVLMLIYRAIVFKAPLCYNRK